MENNEKDFGGTRLTEGDGVSVSVPTPQLTHAAPSPAPWVVEMIAIGECVIASNGDEIAVVYAADGLDEPTVLPAKANAHLIAAAPELLTALKGFVGLLKATGPRLLSAYTELLTDAEAAIAKAEGRQ